MSRTRIGIVVTFTLLIGSSLNARATTGAFFDRISRQLERRSGIEGDSFQQISKAQRLPKIPRRLLLPAPTRKCRRAIFSTYR
jgi:hypothetical protein